MAMGEWISVQTAREMHSRELAGGGPHPRAANLDTPAAERHLTIIVTTPHRGAVRVPLALRTDDLVDLLLGADGPEGPPSPQTSTRAGTTSPSDQTSEWTERS
jgi:hypothetical protein